MEYTQATYNNGLGYSQSINNINTPGGNTTVIQNSDIAGNNEIITSHQDVLGNYSQTYQSNNTIPQVGPVDIQGPAVAARTYGSPPRVVGLPPNTPLSPASPPLHGAAVTGSFEPYGPPLAGRALKLTSSPSRKPVTTTRTNFFAGVTEELISDPMGPPVPFPGETVAVTTTSGVGVFTKVHNRIDPVMGIHETYVNQKNPVRTYTTTVYEDGDIPRTYTTTFEDQPALPPTVTATTTTTFGAQHSTIVESGPNGVIEHVTSSPVSVHRSAVVMSPSAMTKVTTTRTGLHGIETSMGYI